jgi:hypothetical protein
MKQYPELAGSTKARGVGMEDGAFSKDAFSGWLGSRFYNPEVSVPTPHADALHARQAQPSCGSQDGIAWRQLHFLFHAATTI